MVGAESEVRVILVRGGHPDVAGQPRGAALVPQRRVAGDVDEQLITDGVGVLVDEFDKDSYLGAFEQLRSLGDVREKCRLSAKKRFDLEAVGGVRYRRLYERLFCNDRD